MTTNKNNNMNVQKPIVFFDLETTGTNVASDRIVEISAIKVNPDGSQETLTKRINPGVPIPPEATAVHGISDDDVKDSPTFKEVAGEFQAFMTDCDLAGYNILRFDLPLLVEEMLRTGVENFPAPETKFIDAMAIFHHFEKRDLSAAVRFYCGKVHTDAHSAEADTKATVDILQAQIEKYNLGQDTNALHDLCTGGKEIIDYAGCFTRNDKGEIIFAFGKHKGTKVIDKPDYIDWMLKSDFTIETKKKAIQILKKSIE